ncbi:MAG: hypothetical protein RMJ67_07710 [Elusimicrobiota bacterium]|nr:hypothetical protein [Endomicrobiia bacterium]MDW8166378.1 hypothetical protein [Elusimicrobiota bacterium]
MKTKKTGKQANEVCLIKEVEAVIEERPKPQTIREQILQLAEEIKDKYYELSILLSEVYHSKLYEQWGYKTIKEYFELEVGMSYRSGMYHIEMGDAIKKMGISKDVIKGLGWSKFKELAKLSNQATVEEFQQIIKEVKDMSVKEVENFVKKKKIEQAEEKTILTFTLLKEQAEIVEKAIAIAGELLNIPVGEQRGRCLEFICLEFQAHYNPEITDYIKQLMIPDEKFKKAKYKERVDKEGKNGKKNRKN